jgi:hypothetical protein
VKSVSSPVNSMLYKDRYDFVVFIILAILSASCCAFSSGVGSNALFLYHSNSCRCSLVQDWKSVGFVILCY